jgi:hypothetical protein
VPRTRTKSLVAGAALAAASVAIGLLALEAGFRVAHALGWWRTGRGTDFSAYSEYHPVLGWRMRPGARVRFVRREYATDIAVNSHGLRDPERGPAPPAGVQRILALGDSFVEGYTVALEQTVTQRLEQRLRATGCPAEVVNAGTTGYSTDQEYLFYRTDGDTYEASVVLLFFHYNDVVYNDSQWYYGGVDKPVFVFRDGRPEVWKHPVPRSSPRAGEQARAAAGDEDGGAATGSLLLGFVQDRLYYGAPQAYERLAGLGLWAPMRRAETRAELSVYSRAGRPDAESGWEKTGAVLELLRDEVKARAARLLVVYVPSRFEIDDRSWEMSRVRNAMDGPEWDRRAVRDRLASVLRRLDVPLLDLTGPLAEAHGLLGGPYLRRDPHWSALGHDVASRAVQQRLTADGWVCAGSERR